MKTFGSLIWFGAPWDRRAYGYMYHSLREGFRKATSINVVECTITETDEILIQIYRNKELRWGARYNRDILVESPVRDYLARETLFAANKIIDDVLNNVDWDTFY